MLNEGVLCLNATASFFFYDLKFFFFRSFNKYVLFQGPGYIRDQTDKNLHLSNILIGG